MVRFAVIGTNFITDLFLEGAAECKDFELKAVYSRSLDRAAEYAAKYGADLVFDDLNKMAACDKIDAVYIASPNSLHASQSILMMKHGKHVLCEKPIASNYKEVEKMIETAKTHQVVLLEGMRPVFDPGFALIKDNLSKLGQIRRISFQFAKYSSRYDAFRQGVIENAFNPDFSNGALMDIGVYCVYPLAVLFGMPDKIMSSSIKLHNGVEGAGSIFVEYEGMQGELLYSKISTSKAPSQIQGEDATMVIEGIADPKKLTIYYKDGTEEVLNIDKKENNMCYEADAFISLVHNKEIEHPYLEYSKMEMKIADRVRRQQGIVWKGE